MTRPILACLLAFGLFLPSSKSLTAADVASTPDRSKTQTALPNSMTKPAYPKARRVPHTDNYHGTQVADPYRWLEADVRESDEVAAWVAEQQKFTRDYLDKLPRRDELIERLTQLWNYERFSTPRKAGKKYLHSKNDGLQNQSVLYLTDQYDSAGKVLLDPNTWSEDGTVALSGYTPSSDGGWLAYKQSEAGSDWSTIHVLDLNTGEKQPDVLKWIRFTGIEWDADNNGFYYNRYPEPEEGEKFQSVALNQKVYYHKLGTDQSKDVLVYEDPAHPDWTAGVDVSEDGKYLTLEVGSGTDHKNKLYYAPLAGNPPKHGEADWGKLIDDFDNHFNVIGNLDDQLLLFTDYQAPTKRIVSMSLAQPGREALKEIIPASKSTIENVSYVGGQLFVQQLEDVAAKVSVYTPEGKSVREVALPGVGSVGGFGGKSTYQETFFVYTSYDTPSTIYRYDVPTGEVTQVRQPNVAFDPSQFVTERVFYDSLDGTRVPMFITHKKGIKRNHKNPTLLYAYGGFNISITPGFSPSRIAWLEQGGVLAVANLRGGGEYGEEWHLAGKLHNKQNVFDDFIAAAEHLIATGYTEPSHLAIQGGSNGGLLVGAVMTQRPDLFGACLPAVGVMDMLRFHKFTAGQFWRDEYGSADNAEEFPTLLAYSPYHNIKPDTAYPATMIATADTDDRVVPMHSFKFAAELQRAQAGPEPILLRVESRAGHGAGTPTSKRIEQAADTWAFLLHQLQSEAE